MRIVLFASGFNGYDKSIKKALQFSGHEVFHYAYRSDRYSTKFHNRLLHKMKYSLNSSYEIDRWNEKLIELCKESSPDIVFIVKGEVISPETLEWIKINTKAKVICWLMDVIKRYPEIDKLVRLYDYFYTYEPDDIAYLRKQNKNVFYLPLAYDPDNFFPIYVVQKKWDLCFIGTWSKNREEFLVSISSLLKKEKINCIFYMSYYSIFRPLSWGKCLRRKKEFDFIKQHKYFSLKEINMLFNQSKVCLNIHQEFTKNALNIRTFEIIGAGQIQLVEAFNSVKDLFNNNKTIITYNSAMDLVSKLKFALDNYKNKQHPENDHTFEARLNEILKNFNM